MRCETCQSEATVHVEAIGCHFCASCLKKIDERIAEINAAEKRAEKPICHECGGHHEPTGARSDCIRHWKLRAFQAENTANVEIHYGGRLGAELRQWLNLQEINGDTIGSIRRQCFVPWDSPWNALVHDETAAREKTPNNEVSDRAGNGGRA